MSIIIINGDVVSGVSDHIKGNGISYTKAIDILPFKTLQVSGSCNVLVKKAFVPRVHITVDDNLMDFVRVETFDKTLRLGWRNGTNVSTNLGLNILVETYDINIHRVDLSGSGRLEGCVNELTEMSVSGSTRVNLCGTTERLRLKVSGSARLQLREMKAGTVVAQCSGSCKLDIHAYEQAIIGISGSGKCKVSGGGRVSSSVSGSGKVSSVE